MGSTVNDGDVAADMPPQHESVIVTEYGPPGVDERSTAKVAVTVPSVSIVQALAANTSAPPGVIVQARGTPFVGNPPPVT